MHLMELSRFMDRTEAKYVTNDSHQGTLEMLCRMVISLTILSRSRSELLCFFQDLPLNMVYPDRYVVAGMTLQQASMLPMAQAIAGAVLAKLGIYDIDSYFEMLTQGVMLDRGKEVTDIHDVLYMLCNS